MEMEEAIYLVGNSHIDLSWLWPKSETLHEICPRTFNSVLRLIKTYPLLKFSQSSAQIYDWMKNYYPEIFDEIRRQVKEGCWEIVGGSWVEHNAAIICGESLVRQYLFGKRYFTEKFGVDVRVAWLPDTFGFCWSLPQILKKCGIDFFLTHKLKWQIERMKPPIPFPYHIFWWQSADGSRVLAHHTVGSYNQRIDRKYADTVLLAQLEELKKVHGIDQLMVPFGIGDHGGGPTEDMIRAALELKERREYPEVCFSTAEQYFNRVLSIAEGKELPTVNDELYVKTHRGTLTTEAMMKTKNRRCEVLLLTAERFFCIAKRFGFKYPKKELERSWKKLLFNQVHDNMDGTSIEPVYQDAATDYREIENFASRTEHLHAIAKHINTLGKGTTTLIVFNPLSWKRRSTAEVPLSKIGERNFLILDPDGIEVPFQIVGDNGEEKLVFIAEEVPALGYRVYQIVRTQRKADFQTDLKIGKNALENTHFKVWIDPKLNHAVNITHKQGGTMMFNPSSGGNILEVYEDRPPHAPDGEPAWNIYLGNRSEPEAHKVYTVEEGPVRGKLRIERSFGTSSFVQDVILYAGSDQVEFEFHIDWHEDYRFAKVSFPLNLSAHWATYEIPYGVMQRYDHSLKEAPSDNVLTPMRSWEKADTAKWEVSALKWVDVSTSSGEYGVSLLNDSKHGFCFEVNILRMSLLRGPRRGYRFTPESWADQSDMPRVGIHHIRYAIYPHKGDWEAAGTANKGYEFNYPLQVILEEPHSGDLPPQHSFVEVLPKNVILTALKEAEDSRDLIIRMYESSGSHTEAEIRFDEKPSKVWQTDFVEWDKYVPKTEYDIKGKSVFVPVSPWEVKTLRLQYLSRDSKS